MPYTLLIALGAGIISATVFASATTGPLLMRMILVVLTPLPLFLAGLGIGPVTAALAGLAGTAIVFAAGSGVAAIAFAASQAVPVLVLTYLASLNRPAGDETEWFPVGPMVIAAALIAGAFATLTLFLLGGDIDTLRTSLRAGLVRFLEAQFEGVPEAPKLDANQIDEITDIGLVALPAIIASWQMTITLFNFWLGARITLAAGQLARPWPDLSAMTFPSFAPLLLAVATAVGFMSGLPGLIAAGFAGPLFLAYVLVGLSIVHYITRGSSWRPFQLFALYASLVLVYPFSPLVLALLGLAETLWPIRKMAAPRDGPPAS
jgi:hypothetical protein